MTGAYICFCFLKTSVISNGLLLCVSNKHWWKHTSIFAELEAKLKDIYPEEYKKRLQKERKVCSDSFYPLPSCAHPSLQRVRPDFSGITRTQVVLMAILLTVCVCITPMKSLVHNMLKILSFCIDNLLYFLDSALTVMALHDILQLF